MYIQLTLILEKRKLFKKQRNLEIIQIQLSFSINLSVAKDQLVSELEMMIMCASQPIVEKQKNQNAIQLNVKPQSTPEQNKQLNKYSNKKSFEVTYLNEDDNNQKRSSLRAQGTIFQKGFIKDQSKLKQNSPEERQGQNNRNIFERTNKQNNEQQIQESNQKQSCIQCCQQKQPHDSFSFSLKYILNLFFCKRLFRGGQYLKQQNQINQINHDLDIVWILQQIKLIPILSQSIVLISNRLKEIIQNFQHFGFYFLNYKEQYFHSADVKRNDDSKSGTLREIQQLQQQKKISTPQKEQMIECEEFQNIDTLPSKNDNIAITLYSDNEEEQILHKDGYKIQIIPTKDEQFHNWEEIRSNGQKTSENASQDQDEYIEDDLSEKKIQQEFELTEELKKQQKGQNSHTFIYEEQIQQQKRKMENNSIQDLSQNKKSNISEIQNYHMQPKSKKLHDSNIQKNGGSFTYDFLHQIVNKPQQQSIIDVDQLKTNEQSQTNLKQTIIVNEDDLQQTGEQNQLVDQQLKQEIEKAFYPSVNQNTSSPNSPLNNQNIDQEEDVILSFGSHLFLEQNQKLSEQKALSKEQNNKFKGLSNDQDQIQTEYSQDFRQNQQHDTQMTQRNQEVYHINSLELEEIKSFEPPQNENTQTQNKQASKSEISFNPDYKEENGKDDTDVINEQNNDNVAESQNNNQQVETNLINNENNINHNDENNVNHNNENNIKHNDENENN